MVGNFDSNSTLNSIIYDLELPDGAVKQYASNVIAENMYSQVDYNGHSAGTIDVIVDYSKDDTVVTIY